jgi:hypothetical protein
MPKVRRGDVTWVEPKLVAQIEFAEWTRDGRLRAPVYLGLREDKLADEVVAEHVPMPSEIRRGARVLKLSNLDKPFWPDEGITKGDLLAFYRDIAPVLGPHLRDRPFTMKRYPDGWQGKFFFQKDAPSHMPEWIKRAPFPASTRDGEKRIIDYPLVNDELALLWMVNMGCIDMNAWASRVDKPDRPDWVMFDLDPSDDVGFPEVIEVALLVKQLLDLACSSPSRGGRASTRRAPSPRSLRVRSSGRTRASSRPSGRSASAAACSSTRTRTAPARRRLLPTRCGRGQARPSRPPLPGTRCARGSIPASSRWTRFGLGSPVMVTSSRRCSSCASRSRPRCARSAEPR